VIVACVRTGSLYPIRHVEILRNMVKRNLRLPYRMVCLTDQPERCHGVEFIDISTHGLHGWWGKMKLFDRDWREGERVLYFDLDTVICGRLEPLASLAVDLAICGNFARQHGNKTWPCKYGSCVMVLGERLTGFVWNVFNDGRRQWIDRFARHGDQRMIEEAYPDALLIQDALPDFAISYRALHANPPPRRTSIINFGGRSKPDNCTVPWVREFWR